MRAKMLLALSGTAGLLFALWFGGSIATAAPPAPPVKPEAMRAPVSARAPIQWQPNHVLARLAAGQTTYETTVTFTSTVPITSATVSVRAAGASFLTVTPTSVTDVAAGTPVPVTIRVAVPAGGKARQVGAAVYLTQNSRPLPAPLPVTIVLPPPPRPEVVWSTPAISLTVAPGATVETDVSFTSTLTLTQASVVTPHMPGSVITVTPRSLGQVAPGTPVTLRVQVSLPANKRVRPAGGMIQIRDGRQIIPRPLPIRVNVTGPQPDPRARPPAMPPNAVPGPRMLPPAANSGQKSR